MRLVPAGSLTVGVYNCDGGTSPSKIGARTTTPSLRGRLGAEVLQVVCPRHGSRFDLETGIPCRACLRGSTDLSRLVRDDGMVVARLPDP